MAQIIGGRDTAQVVTETRLIRFVREDGLLLEPNEQPMVTLLMKIGAKKPCDSPRIEWFEDDYVARWGQNGASTIAAATASVTITVGDGTVLVKGDLIIWPNAVDSSTAPEINRVTAVTGNVATVTRAYAGTTVQAKLPLASYAVLGQAHEESAAVSTAKTTAPSAKISYTEIFKASVNLSRTMIASKVYSAPGGDRRRLHEKKLKEVKIAMNRSFLFGKASETTGGDGGQLRSTMGLNSVISTNVTNGGGAITETTMLTFAEQAFRYGTEKVLLASPKVISAITHFAASKQQLKPGGKLYGVNIMEYHTGHGKWFIMKDQSLEDGVSGKNGFGGWALSIDPDSIEYYYLSGNGEDRDLKITENAVRDGADRVIDEALTECGLRIMHEKRFAKLYNVTSFS